MTKSDLLTALGDIDEKYICKAFEKASAENVLILDERETKGRVGAMDKKKYIKNKIVPIVAVAASVILCVGSLIYITQRNNDDKITPQDNSAVTSQSESEQSDSSTEISESTPDCVYEVFNWGDNEEFAEHIYKIVSDKGFVNTTYKLQDGTTEEIIYLYEFDCIEGYSLFSRYQTGSNYVYSFYRKNGDRTGSATNEITMTWEIGTESQSALQSKIDYYNSQGYAVNEISNMPGYYYVDFDEFQKVMWCEAGYYFELQFPVSVGRINTSTHAYTGEYLFSLKKSQYIIDESGNATELDKYFSESPYELFQKRLIELQTQNPNEPIVELTYNDKLGALSGYGIGIPQGNEENVNSVEQIKEFINNTDLAGEELDAAILDMVYDLYYIKIEMGSGVYWDELLIDKDGKHIVTDYMGTARYRYYDVATKTYCSVPLSEIGFHGEFDDD
ncbi:MAG: hypothetical protein IJO29_07455 [Oscillospiraceae bacterium]|nr:hypothetical protein [Oscillospiraceae bacterium]